ncbi:MAG TPA: multiheme c-type cytochrome [Planctomycetota bacterium]|nr:multiheme c-type cytochrome [Planctomycetota bacterium]
MRLSLLLLPVPLLLLALAFAEDPSPFSPSRLRTPDGKPADPDDFFEAADCGACHEGQWEQWKGSLHNRAHDDGIYRAFAELARTDAGEETYRFCSSCHTPLAIATGKEDFLAHEGVTCDVCHRIRTVDVVHGGGGANASFLLEAGDVRYGPLEDPSGTPAHKSAYSETHRSAQLCSACHTLLHPGNGLPIENTYEEWAKGPYAKARIQCQDCHMRSAEQAAEVARTMKPLKVPGTTLGKTGERPDVHDHRFSGASTDATLTGGAHAAESEARLRAAVELAVKADPRAGALEVAVSLTNVGAGHAIPTSITELRQVWIDLRVTDAKGAEVFRSGAVDADGRVDPGAVMYHSVLLDAKGEVTYLPWRAVKMAKEKLLPPKETVIEKWEVGVPAGAEGPLQVAALLRYRAAPQEVMDALFGKDRFDLRIVDMATARAEVALAR